MEPDRLEITSINGPISFHILKSPDGKETFYLFGDAHFSKDLGCDGQESLTMSKDGAGLTPESIESNTATSIDFDAAVYLLLAYGKASGAPTDAFIEVPIHNESALSEKVGWFHNVSKLMQHRKSLEPSTIRGVDARKIGKGGTNIFSALLSAARVLSVIDNVEAYYREFVAFMTVCGIVLKQRDVIIGAILQVGAVRGLNRVYDLIRELPASLTRSMCMLSIQSTIDNSEPVMFGGRPLLSHAVAKSMYDLKSVNEDTREIAELNESFFLKKWRDLSDKLVQADTLGTIASGVLKYTGSEEVSAQVANYHFTLLETTLINIQMYIMDLYCMSEAFLSRAPVKVIAAGNYHISSYKELLTKVHGYESVLSESNCVERCLEDPQEVPVYTGRCIVAPDLASHVDFGLMRDVVYHSA